MDPLWSETYWSNFKYFKYFIIILIVSTNYIFVNLLDNKVFYFYITIPSPILTVPAKTEVYAMWRRENLNILLIEVHARSYWSSCQLFPLDEKFTHLWTLKCCSSDYIRSLADEFPDCNHNKSGPVFRKLYAVWSSFLNELITWRSVYNAFARKLQSASCLLAFAFLSLRTSARPGKFVFGLKLNFDVDLFCVEIGGQLRDLFRNFQFYDTCSWKGNKARQDCEVWDFIRIGSVLEEFTVIVGHVTAWTTPDLQLSTVWSNNSHSYLLISKALFLIWRRCFSYRTGAR